MRRNLYIHARISQAEGSGLNVIAQRENISLSETVRQLLREGLDRRGLSVALADFYKNLPAKNEAKNADRG